MKPGSEPFQLKQPLLLMFKTPQDKVQCHLYPEEGMTHEHYGLLICDLIRHVAACFKVSEDDIFEWIERERDKPTTKLEGGRLM